MHNLKIIGLTLVVAISMAGCVFGTEQNSEGPVLGDAATSGCKVESGLTLRSLIDGNMIEAVAYDTSATIIHHDAQYQCNADISWEMEINGEELTLREVDKSVEVVRCMCPVDLSININNLTPGKTYHVTVWDEFETKMFGEVWVTVGDCGQQCTVAEDCWAYPDLPTLDCVGNWACIEGLCNYYCDDVPTGCYSDADCAEGFQCVFYAMPVDVGGTGVEAGAPTERMIALMDCTVDADCPEGMYCVVSDCACEPGVDCDCYPYGYCEGGQTWPTEGVCEPIVVNNECRSDADCGSGYHCEFYYPMAGDASGAAEADPMPPIDCMCTEEWAPVCGYDGVTYSNKCFAYCAGVEISYEGECDWGQGIGYCVPDEEPGCYSDADCPEGYVCEMTDWCAGTDADGDGLVDPSWCLGQCVYGNVDTCETMGGFCLPFAEDGNAACPEGYAWFYGNSSNTPVCGGEAMCCVPNKQECYSDEDCYNIYGGGQEDPAAGVAARWTCVDGYCQAPTECGTYECYSDQDCGDGYMCVGMGYCDEAGYCCDSTACVPVEQPYCADDVPCAEGEVCENGVCVWVEPGCDSNGACADGYVCVEGACVIDGCYCTQEYAPVCGDDGQTYGNACMAKCSGVGIRYEGECEIVEPVCASDADCGDGYVCMNGVCTWPQEECRMDDTGMCVCGGFAGFACPEGMGCVYDDPNCSPENGGADCMGHCYAVPDECVCDAMYAPVCGSDGVTYSNKCMAICAGVRPLYEGECVQR